MQEAAGAEVQLLVDPPPRLEDVVQRAVVRHGHALRAGHAARVLHPAPPALTSLNITDAFSETRLLYISFVTKLFSVLNN